MSLKDNYNLILYKQATLGDIPGGPVAECLHSQCKGPEFYPFSGN